MWMSYPLNGRAFDMSLSDPCFTDVNAACSWLKVQR
jgi:hypothetical protein